MEKYSFLSYLAEVRLGLDDVKLIFPGGWIPRAASWILSSQSVCLLCNKAKMVQVAGTNDFALLN